MKKQYVVIKYGDKPIVISPVIDGTSEEYLKIKKDAEINLKNLFEEFNGACNQLVTRLNNLEKEIKHLKGEE